MPLHRENIGNVIGGHKANISNPHISSEAKDRSKGVLEDLGTTTHRENLGNVIGGHKANIANPHTSEEAKERSKEILGEIGSETKSSKMTADGKANTQGKNLGRWS